MENNIKIFADGANIEEFDALNKLKVEGYTFNPSLYRKNNVTDYLGHSKKIISLIQDKPVSLEVTADSFDNMFEQAMKLHNLGPNVYVKVPITNTTGSSTIDVIKKFRNHNIKINVTAVFTYNQVENIIDEIKDTESIISIFAGRLFDIGIDAVDHTKKISELISNRSNCQSLWASTRMVYDLFNAQKSGCDIITMGTDIIKKIDLIGIKPEDYSLETVKMFYNDALKANYNF